MNKNLIVFYILLLLIVESAYSQDIQAQNFQGEIGVFTQTENLSCFSTIIGPNKYHLYVMNKNDSTYFIKQFEEQPIDIIASENYKKIIVCFDGKGFQCESYKYKMYGIYRGDEQYFPPLHTKLKLTKEGKYLFSSIHLFDNSSPLDIYELETNENFVVEIKWSKVSSLGKNKLVVLERLSGRNKHRLKYNEEMDNRRVAFFKERSKQRVRYKRGEISKSEFLKIEDSLKHQNLSNNPKAPKGTWTQLGTKMWIYDLESRSFIFDTILQDKKGNPVILNRDDLNSYSLSVDEQANIYINGLMRHEITNYLGVKVTLKYNSKYELDWLKIVDKY